MGSRKQTSRPITRTPFACSCSTACSRSKTSSTAPTRLAYGTGASQPMSPDSSLRSSSTAFTLFASMSASTPLRRLGSAHAWAVTCTDRTGCTGWRGITETGTCQRLRFPAWSAASRRSVPRGGRVASSSRNAPSSSSEISRPARLNRASGSTLPAMRIGSPTRCAAGESRRSSGAAVSTSNEIRRVRRREERPGDADLEQMLPVGELAGPEHEPVPVPLRRHWTAVQPPLGLCFALSARPEAELGKRAGSERRAVLGAAGLQVRPDRGHRQGCDGGGQHDDGRENADQAPGESPLRPRRTPLGEGAGGSPPRSAGPPARGARGAPTGGRAPRSPRPAW